MRRGNLELAVGGFVLLGLVCLAYLAVHLGKMEVWGGGFRVVANFDNVSGLDLGAPVEVAGVHVGLVESIRLTSGDRAAVTMKLEPGLEAARRCHRFRSHQGHHRRPVYPTLPRQFGKAHSPGGHYSRHRERHQFGRIARHHNSRQDLSPAFCGGTDAALVLGERPHPR